MGHNARVFFGRGFLVRAVEGGKGDEPVAGSDDRQPPAAGPAGTLRIAAVALLASACQPTVKVEAPDKPIVINLNVKIEQEVRIKVEREVDDLLQKNPDLF